MMSAGRTSVLATVVLVIAAVANAGAAQGMGASSPQSSNASQNSPQRSAAQRSLAPEGTAPPPVDPAWAELIGEYRSDRGKLYVLEKDGRLNLLIGRSLLVRLRELAPSSSPPAATFAGAGPGPYAGEKLTFLRGSQRAVDGLRWKGTVFPREPEEAQGQIFRVKPLHTIDELRKDALASHPPVEAGSFLKPDLVQIRAVDPSIKLDIRYATTRDFLGIPLYSEARAFLERPAAEALSAASKRLRALGYGLLVYDAYRPWYVTKMFWEAVPGQERIFVANPRKGSRHNRGCAVDLTLYDLKTGLPVEMTGGYDEMSERSYPTYPGGTSLARWHRDLLRRVMESEGFTVNPYEWWHFDYKDWRRYPILNLTFESLENQGL
jgi:D-alanyl-D-alanine dipeptidase